MSLILEALKKSEEQRRLGEAPTLGSPMLAVRRRRSLLPVFAAAILIALGAGWWLSRTPDGATDVSTGDGAKPAPAATATAPVAKPGGPGPTRRDAPASAPATAANKPATATANGAVANKPAPTVNDRTAAQPGAAKPATGNVAVNPQRPGPAPGPLAGTGAAGGALAANRSAAGNAAAGKPDTGKTAPTAPANAAVAATHSATTTDAPVPAATPSGAAPTQVASATPAKTPATQAQAPALPVLWELPYATRKDIPELTLTMHVYTSDPAQRFVVVKGDRHVEGDDLGDGLKIAEIRADGMVLDYKGQRFVYPRAGR